MFKSFLPSLAASGLSTTFGTLTCLQPGAVPRQTAGLSEAYTETQTRTQRHRGEKREREGMRDISTGLEIDQDWSRSEPACLATCLTYEFSKEVMSRYPHC